MTTTTAPAILLDSEPVHIFVGAPRSNPYYGQSKGYETTAGEARATVLQDMATDPSEVTVRALADPCLAFRWLPSHQFLGIQAGWRVQHLRGYCRPGCQRNRR